jgi:hypothetical protein
VARGSQRRAQVATDEAGSAGNEDAHGRDYRL